MPRLRTGRLTLEERLQIVELAANGLVAKEIAIAVGRAYGTVDGLIRRTGVGCTKASRRWSDEETARLCDLVRKGLSDAAIGIALERTADAIHARILWVGGRDLILYPAGRKAPPPAPPAAPARPTIGNGPPEPWDLWRAAMRRLSARTAEASHA